MMMHMSLFDELSNTHMEISIVIGKNA